MLGPLEDLLARGPAAVGLERSRHAGGRSIATACGCSSWSTRCSISRASRRAGTRPCTSRPTSARSRPSWPASSAPPIERAGLAFEVGCAAGLRAGLRRSRDVGEDRPQPAVQRVQVHVRGRHRRRARDAATAVELVVRDTGIGIAPDEIDRVFERFHRVEERAGPHPRGLRHRAGAGPGARAAARRDGAGRERAGPGDAFTVTVPRGRGAPAGRPDRTGAPRARPPPARACRSSRRRCGGCPTRGRRERSARRPRRPAQPVRPGGRRRFRVLVADDNADMREYVARLLRRRWEVEAVGDGQAALAVAPRAAGRPRADRRHDAGPRRLRAAAGRCAPIRPRAHAGDPAVGARGRGVARRGAGGRRRRLPRQAVLGARAGRARGGAPQAEGAARGAARPSARCSSTASRRRGGRRRRRPRSSRRSTASASAGRRDGAHPARAGVHRRGHEAGRRPVRRFFYNVIDEHGRVVHALHDRRGAPGGVREVPAAAQHRAVRAHVPRRGRHPHGRRHAGPALRPERAPPRDAARPPAGDELPRGAGRLPHRRGDRRAVPGPREAGDVPGAAGAHHGRGGGPARHRHRQRPAARQGAAGAGRGRGGQPGQGRVPGRALPRAAHAAERRLRLGPDAALRRASRARRSRGRST